MSNKEKTVVRTGGISFSGLLAIVFIVLKLTNVIDWSWWWVTAPIWIPLSFGIALIVISAILLKLL
jgi:hypothetical protein